MAPITRAQRQKVAEAPAPQAELPSVSTPVESLPAAILTTPPNNPPPAPVIALSSSNHSTHRLTLSEAGRLYPPPILTPIKAQILTASTLLTIEAIAANQEILAQNVEALHDRMERIENLLQEVVRAQKERAEGYRLLEEQEVELWSPRDYPRHKMKWHFADQDSAEVYGAGAEREDRARERRSKRPAVGDMKRKTEGNEKPVGEVKRRTVENRKGKGKAKEE
ncbi:hypothetical protein RUND412_007236 [Rhizina undulata]